MPPAPWPAPRPSPEAAVFLKAFTQESSRPFLRRIKRRAHISEGWLRAAPAASWGASSPFCAKRVFSLWPWVVGVGSRRPPHQHLRPLVLGPRARAFVRGAEPCPLAPRPCRGLLHGVAVSFSLGVLGGAAQGPAGGRQEGQSRQSPEPPDAGRGGSCAIVPPPRGPGVRVPRPLLWGRRGGWQEPAVGRRGSTLHLRPLAPWPPSGPRPISRETGRCHPCLTSFFSSLPHQGSPGPTVPQLGARWE